MKKIYNYLLFTILCFMCFVGVTNAANKCTYYYDVNNAGAYEEGKRIEVVVNYSDNLVDLVVNGKTLKNWSPNDGIIHSSSEYPKITYKTDEGSVDYYLSLGQFISLVAFPNEKFESCPILKVRVRDVKFSDNKKGYMLLLYDQNSGDIYGEDELQTKIDTVLGEETTYKVNFNRCDATTKNSDASAKCDDVVGGQQGSIYIKVSKNGTYKIGIDNTYNTINESNENVWEGTYKYRKFVISKSEWSQIKNVFTFNGSVNEDNTKSLVITPKENYFVISLNGINDGDGESTEARGDTTIYDDSRYTFKLIDLIISKDAGMCESYLGLADEEGKPAYYLQIAFTIIKLVSIILVVVMSMIEFAGTITSDKDKLKEAINKFVKRLIIVIVLLLIPTFIDMIGNILDIENILCGIK